MPGAEGQQARPNCSQRRLQDWPPRSSKNFSIPWMLHSRQPQQTRNPTRATVAQLCRCNTCELKGFATALIQRVGGQPAHKPAVYPSAVFACKTITQQPRTHFQRGAAPHLTSCLICSCQR